MRRRTNKPKAPKKMFRRGANKGLLDNGVGRRDVQLALTYGNNSAAIGSTALVRKRCSFALWTAK